MKKTLIAICVLAIAGMHTNTFSQFCGAATFQSNISPTAFTQTTPVVNSGRPYWTFNGVAGCTYVFSTCGLTSMDSYLRLYSGTNPATAILLVQNDDAPCGPTGFQSNISWLCPVNGSYSILLTRYSFPPANSCDNVNANVSLSYSLACTSPPVNNGCGTPTSITPQLTCQFLTGTTITSTETFPPSTCSGFTGSAANDVWYSFTTGGTINVTITVDGSPSFDAVLGLYSACNAASLITCIDATVEGGVETINAGVLPAGTYYYRIYSYWGLTGTFSTCVVRDSPLPIELIEFTGSCDEQTGYRKLDWVTASESNNDHFTIERSLDAVEWKRIREVAGAGNSNTELSYTWIDTEPISQPTYYRLSQTDFNGQSETFKTVYLFCESDDTTPLVWKNCNDGNFQLRFTELPGTNVVLTLTNSMGSIVTERTVTATGYTVVPFNESLAPGMYYLTIYGKTVQTVKVCVE